MVEGQCRGPLGIARQDRVQDLAMLPPNRGIHAGITEHGLNSPAEMHPLRTGDLLDQGITGQAIQRNVKGNVRLDSVGKGLFSGRVEMAVDQIVQRGEFFPLNLPTRDPLRRQTRGQGIHGAAYLIEVHQMVGVHRRNREALAPELHEDALLTQNLQRVTNRLTRDPKLAGDFDLPQTVAGLEGTVDDTAEDRVTNPLGQFWFRGVKLNL